MEMFTKKDLRVLVESTGYPMSSVEKITRMVELDCPR